MTDEDPVDEQEAPSLPGSGGRARGYTFQDAVAGLAMLEVLFERAVSVTIEGSFGTGDKFDDVILERPTVTEHFQIKNGPKHDLEDADLKGDARGLRLGPLLESAKKRIAGGGNMRFIILTSFGGIDDDLKVAPCAERLDLFGLTPGGLHELASGRGEVAKGIALQFATRFPHLETSDDNSRATLALTRLFEKARAFADELLQKHPSPAFRDGAELVERVIQHASYRRGIPGPRLTRDVLAKQLRIAPASRLIAQDFPEPPGGRIEPAWVKELRAKTQPGVRLLIEGSPGIGKSTTIEVEQTGSKLREVKLHLFVPTDSPARANERLRPDHFREQLAGQIGERFSEAFPGGSIPVWSSVEDLNGYIATAAAWAAKNTIDGTIIIDGLDHALRQYGDAKEGRTIEGSLLIDIGKLEVPAPLSLVMLSRPLDEDAKKALRIDATLTVTRWTTEEVLAFLDARGFGRDPALAERAREVAGGLPVILAHLVRLAAAKDPADPKAGLELALKEAPTQHGDLQAYYQAIWKALQVTDRDAAELIAVSPDPPEEDRISSIISLPWAARSLHEGLLGTVTERLPRGRVRLFHDTFREFVLNQLEPSELKKLHKTLYRDLAVRWALRPQHTRELIHHADGADLLDDAKHLLTLDTVLVWWSNGAHLEQALSALSAQLALGARTHDARHMLDCVVLGGVSSNVITQDLDDQTRLRYFRAADQGDAAVSLSHEMRKRGSGRSEGLGAMIFLAQELPADFDPEWMESWLRDFEDANDPPDVPPELLFRAVASAVPERFWEIAGMIGTVDDRKHFVREAVLSAGAHSNVLAAASSPPDWFREDIPGLLEALAEVPAADVPTTWKETLASTVPDLATVTIPALLGALRLGVDRASVLAEARLRKLEEPQSFATDRRSFQADAFYLGALLREAGETPDAVAAAVKDAAMDAKTAHQILAFMGAAATARPAEQRQWAEALLDLVARVEAAVRLGSKARSYLSWNNYKAAFQRGFARAHEALNAASPETLSETRTKVSAFPEGDHLFTSLQQATLNALRGAGPQAAQREAIAIRFRELALSPPQQGNAAQELMELAADAASVDRELAKTIFNEAVARSFHYGFRKDTWLDDVWDGLKILPRDGWSRDLGTAIQLLNWSRLLHEITDGKETRHYEGNILADLLSAGAIEYSEVEQRTGGLTHQHVTDWRIENPDWMDEKELRALLEDRIMRERTSSYDDPLNFFARVAIIAADNGWNGVAKDAILAMASASRGADRLKKDVANQVRAIGKRVGADPPADIDKEKADPWAASKPTPPEAPDAARDLLLAATSDRPAPDQLDQMDADLLKRALGQVGRLGPDVERSIAPLIAQALARKAGNPAAARYIADLMADKNAMNWYLSGRDVFKHLVLALEAVAPDDVLPLTLDAWRRARTRAVTYMWMMLDNLIWLVLRTRGEIEGRALHARAMHWTRRLLQPHEDAIQKWGRLSSD